MLQGCLLVNNCLINRQDSIHFHQHNASLVSAGWGIIQRLTVFTFCRNTEENEDKKMQIDLLKCKDLIVY